MKGDMNAAQSATEQWRTRRSVRKCTKHTMRSWRRECSEDFTDGSDPRCAIRVEKSKGS